MDRFRRLKISSDFFSACPSAGLRCLVVASILLISAQTSGEARTRVSTGSDLHQFCQLAVNQRLSQTDGRLTGKARYCRQYVSGFFSSLQAMQAGEGTHKIHPNDDTERFQCSLVPRAATYEQLERQIVHFGEWHPELLDEPAIRLIQRAFDSLDPC
jgi:Ssp1 endopeptidase immunity protein Rap1a